MSLRNLGVLSGVWYWMFIRVCHHILDYTRGVLDVKFVFSLLLFYDIFFNGNR